MRCYKCDGCVSGFDIYRPEWCEDEKCPQGDKEPEDIRAERKAQLERFFKGGFTSLPKDNE